MTAIITIALLAGIPVVLIFLLRVNAAIVFLALCAGSVLVQFISADTTNVFSSFIPASGTINSSIVQLGLLYAPAFFTVVFMRKAVSGAKAIVNLLPAVATGLVGVLLAVPLLPSKTETSITTTHIWSSLNQYQSVVVGTSVVISLFILWFGRPKHGKDKHK